jgi:hypothetical protein
MQRASVRDCDLGFQKTQSENNCWKRKGNRTGQAIFCLDLQEVFIHSMGQKDVHLTL